MTFASNSNFLNSKFINPTNSNDPAAFTSRQIPQGISGTKSNVEAAKGIYHLKGGSQPRNFFSSRFLKTFLEKQKQKKMRNSLRKRTSRHRFHSNRCKCRKCIKKYTRRIRNKRGGGYHQYQSNVPNTPSFSTAGQFLSSGNLAQANPPPITRTMNCGN